MALHAEVSAFEQRASERSDDDVGGAGRERSAREWGIRNTGDRAAGTGGSGSKDRAKSSDRRNDTDCGEAGGEVPSGKSGKRRDRSGESSN